MPNKSRGAILGLSRIRLLAAKEDLDVEAMLGTPALAQHPHQEVARWTLKSGLATQSTGRGSILEAFEHALDNNGRLMRGVVIGSPEHAAALAGAALWRHHNPSKTKGGAGRGQGRRAADGLTNLVRMTVNVRTDHPATFKSLGGSVWLRQQIDRASLDGAGKRVSASAGSEAAQSKKS